MILNALSGLYLGSNYALIDFITLDPATSCRMTTGGGFTAVEKPAFDPVVNLDS